MRLPVDFRGSTTQMPINWYSNLTCSANNPTFPPPLQGSQGKHHIMPNTVYNVTECIAQQNN